MPHTNIVHVVDPDDAIGEALTALLGTYDIAVRCFRDAEEYLTKDIEFARRPGCLLVEADLPGRSGLSLLRQLREQNADFPVIVLSSDAKTDLRRQALRLGATEVVEKPLMNDFLLKRLPQLLPIEFVRPDVAADSVKLGNGTHVTIRAMRPEDAEIEQAFVRGLSLRSRYLRFFYGLKQLTAKMLEEFTHTHYPDTFALIATVAEDNRETQIGVARYAPTAEDGVAEFAVVIADEWQGQGVATLLLRGITTAAAIAGIRRLEGVVLKENIAMLNLAIQLGFRRSRHQEGGSVVRVVKDLRGPDGAALQNCEQGSNEEAINGE